MKRPYLCSSSFSLAPLFLAALLACLFVALVPNRSSAQIVLESGGVTGTAPSIIELRTTSGDNIDVEEITGRATATARGYGGTATASAESTVHVCETPCRFQLQRPMEVRVDVHAVRLRSDGTAQRYLIDPENKAGSALGFLAMSLGGTALLTGAILVGIDAIPASEFEDDDDDDMSRFGVISLVAGSALFVVGLVVRVLSKGRIKRVDRFDF